jgi:hypothetical protein
MATSKELNYGWRGVEADWNGRILWEARQPNHHHDEPTCLLGEPDVACAFGDREDKLLRAHRRTELVASRQTALRRRRVYNECFALWLLAPGIQASRLNIHLPRGGREIVDHVPIRRPPRPRVRTAVAGFKRFASQGENLSRDGTTIRAAAYDNGDENALHRNPRRRNSMPDLDPRSRTRRLRLALLRPRRRRPALLTA